MQTHTSALEPWNSSNARRTLLLASGFTLTEPFWSQQKMTEGALFHIQLPSGTPATKHVYPERPAGVEGSLMYPTRIAVLPVSSEVEGSERSESKDLSSLHRYRRCSARG